MPFFSAKVPADFQDSIRLDKFIEPDAVVIHNLSVHRPRQVRQVHIQQLGRLIAGRMEGHQNAHQKKNGCSADEYQFLFQHRVLTSDYRYINFKISFIIGCSCPFQFASCTSTREATPVISPVSALSVNFAARDNTAISSLLLYICRDC